MHEDESGIILVSARSVTAAEDGRRKGTWVPGDSANSE